MRKVTYRYCLATNTKEIQAYFDLRHDIFCEEQGLFPESERDEIDGHAYPIVAVDEVGQVIGVVRIYETESGLWYGGRLGVHRDYRRRGRVGQGLIYKAVTTAHAWGCHTFLATVQLQNVRFFSRLHWDSLKELTICDRPHHLMQADLDHYPPILDVRPTRIPLEVNPCAVGFSA
ncbi:MAG: MSMEG_0567/Sll0786 family nitrogen starvation N-acetyltransferase [Cyanobacteria bacterium P01_H01_bin.15]